MARIIKATGTATAGPMIAGSALPESEPLVAGDVDSDAASAVAGEVMTDVLDSPLFSAITDVTKTTLVPPPSIVEGVSDEVISEVMLEVLKTVRELEAVIVLNVVDDSSLVDESSSLVDESSSLVDESSSSEDGFSVADGDGAPIVSATFRLPREKNVSCVSQHDLGGRLVSQQYRFWLHSCIASFPEAVLSVHN